jgi:hypothetical protein
VSETAEAPCSGRLPDMPGKAPGVVGVRESPRGKVYTLQCERCFATEEPEHLLYMTIHFHPRSRDGENQRLCRYCRIAANPDCICDYCHEDQKAKKQGEGKA